MPMDSNVLWWRNKILEKVAASLVKNQFEVEICQKREDVMRHVLGAIPVSAKVGIGGSMSIRELNIIDHLKERSQKLAYHTNLMTKEEAGKSRIEAFTADFYLASPQAVTMDGKVIFLDHHANRSAAVSFGPGSVILPTGFNKIAFDESSGIFRAKNVAAPINCKRLNLKTPCAETGICTDCDSPSRICRVLEVMHKKPASIKVKIVLCVEEFGY